MQTKKKTRNLSAWRRLSTEPAGKGGGEAGLHSGKVNLGFARRKKPKRDAHR